MRIGCECPECLKALHKSDCAVHREYTEPNGECNCGATPYNIGTRILLKFLKETHILKFVWN